MKRRKYQFADRATAEEECRRQAAWYGRYRRALDGAIRGEVQWIRGDRYDAGVIPNDVTGGLCLVTYHGRNLDQKSSTTVYDDEEIRDWRNNLILNAGEQGSEERELIGLLSKAQEMMYIAVAS